LALSLNIFKEKLANLSNICSYLADKKNTQGELVLSRSLFIGNFDPVYELFAMVLLPHHKLNGDRAVTCREAVEMVSEKEHEIIIILAPTLDDPGILFEHLKLFKKQIPILFTADENNMASVHELVPYHPQTSKVCYNSGGKAIGASIKKLLRISAARQKENESHYPMPSEYFVSAKQTPFDIFILINKTLTRIYKAGDSISKEDIIQYKQKNVHEFHLKASDYEKASTEFMARISANLETKQLRTEVLSSVAKFGHEAVCRLVMEAGIKDEVLEIADASIKAMNKIVGKSAHLTGYIQSILQGKGFASEHTILTGFIANAIAHEVLRDNDQVSEKLTMAAFFHDVALEDPDLEEMEDPFSVEGVSEAKLMRFKLHPSKVSDYLNDISGIPQDVDRIIAHHHEKPDGTGFPHKKTWKSIFPVAAVFIVAHDLSVCLYQGGLQLEFLEDILDEFDQKYDKGNFKLAMKGLRKALALESYSEIEEDLLLKLG
jgi:hypothetical protein